MASFAGFPSGKVRTTPVPSAFFTDLLPQIDHLGELKVTLYAIWFLDRQEGNIRFLTYQDFVQDEKLLAALCAQPSGASQALEDALARAVRRGSLLAASQPAGGKEATLYFLNSARGRAALKAFENGQWSPESGTHVPVALDQERPNIYRLYEENIGPLTPLISDALREAEQNYPMDWIDEAIRKAVFKNARHWRYVEAILRSWKENGRNDTDRRDAEEDRRRYFEGELGDYIEH
jgi:DnaD/phage-associated family protein